MAQGHIGAECGLEGLHGGDFFRGRERAALELDGFEAEFLAHGLRLGDDAVGVERGFLARGRPAGGVRVLVEPECAARAFVFVEEVGGEVHTVAGAAAEQIADGATGGFAHDVVAGDFDGADGAHEVAMVPGLFAARCGARFAEAVVEADLDGVELEGVLADDDFAGGFQGGGGFGAARDFAEAVDAVVGDDFEDDAQRVGRMQAGGVEQGRVGDGDGRDAQFGDLHVVILLWLGGCRVWEYCTIGEGWRPTG